MTASAFADKLEALANDIGDVPRHELAVILRRAAIRIRSKPGLNLNDEDEAALAAYMRDLNVPSRNEALLTLVRDALMTTGYMQFHDLYDDFERGE